MVEIHEVRHVKRAWVVVLLLVSAVTVLGSSVLWVYGFSALICADVCMVVLAMTVFFIHLGYFVKIPSSHDLVSAKTRAELEAIARYLCIDSSGDSIELRRAIEAFISANSGAKHAWVMPRRLRTALGRVGIA